MTGSTPTGAASPAGPSDLHLPWGSVPGPDAGEPISLSPQKAGWTYCGLSVLQLKAGVAHRFSTGENEMFLLPLAGGFSVEISPFGAGSVEASYRVTGRDSVFTRVTDFVYVGRDSDVTLVSSTDAEIALPSSRCEGRLESRYGPADAVAVELRGSGTATRQVNGFGVPGLWDHAEKLIAVELITPPGNWSSYPPHKHDASAPCPVVNEEIYFFKIAGPDQITPSREGFGYHRTYTGAEHTAAGLAELDVFLEVRDGDVALVPHGYHGPCVAAHGYPMYYLNVMAGPDPERSMAFCDDPAHTWIRGSWADLPLDPRCPVTTAEGRTGD